MDIGGDHSPFCVHNVIRVSFAEASRIYPVPIRSLHSLFTRLLLLSLGQSSLSPHFPCRSACTHFPCLGPKIEEKEVFIFFAWFLPGILAVLLLFLCIVHFWTAILMLFSGFCLISCSSHSRVSIWSINPAFSKCFSLNLCTWTKCRRPGH